MTNAWLTMFNKVMLIENSQCFLLVIGWWPLTKSVWINHSKPHSRACQGQGWLHRQSDAKRCTTNINCTPECTSNTPHHTPVKQLGLATSSYNAASGRVRGGDTGTATQIDTRPTLHPQHTLSRTLKAARTGYATRVYLRTSCNQEQPSSM